MTRPARAGPEPSFPDRHVGLASVPDLSHELEAGDRALLQGPGSPADGQAPRLGLSVIPSPRPAEDAMSTAGAGMVRCDGVRGGRDQSEGATTPTRLVAGAGVMTSTICVHREDRAAHAASGRAGRQRMW